MPLAVRPSADHRVTVMAVDIAKADPAMAHLTVFLMGVAAKRTHSRLKKTRLMAGFFMADFEP
jgi:hypothetical protein